MARNIKAICFDVGGTLRAGSNRGKRNLDYIQTLQEFLGNRADPLTFKNTLSKREKTYRRWCKRTLIELPETDLWAKFILPDFPQDFVRENAVKLNQMWRASSKSEILPDAVATIKALKRNGYPLAIISNTTSSLETPQMLTENGLSNEFEAVILSCVHGRRKPHPSLFLEAARAMGVAPCQCAYVGNNLSRDMIGARQAGYGEMVIINLQGYRADEDDLDDDVQVERITEMKPDHCIGKLGELLEIYPGSKTIFPAAEVRPQPKHLYEVALSTMWGADQKQPFNATFIEAQQLGVTCFELTNKVTPALYQQWDHNRFYIATVHDPCPSEESYAELKKQDIAISSLDEKRRLQSLDGLKQSIELAHRLGSKSVVIHCGTVLCDHSKDLRLREMVQKGLRSTAAYENLREEFIADRAAHAEPHIEQVIKSLQEVITFSKGSHVALGMENRNRYYDIPLPDELALFLDLCPKDWFGFQYDLGHAHNQDVLGTVPHSEWITRFKQRMIGVHLHDVKGIEDHLVPGMGEIDFTRIAVHIPAGTLRTLEISSGATREQIARGLEILSDAGCINKIL